MSEYFLSSLHSIIYSSYHSIIFFPPMRPKLKISHLTNLQDARYSAAVGFDYVSFCMERGHAKKLAPELVWNIANWLEGPEIILEVNADSMAELAETKVTPAMVAMPLADWPVEISEVAVVLRTDTATEPAVLAEMLAKGTASGKNIFFELSLKHPDQLQPFLNILDRLFLHFPSLQMAHNFLKSGQHLPYGISLREEAEEAPGELNYEMLDELVAIYSDVHL